MSTQVHRSRHATVLLPVVSGDVVFNWGDFNESVKGRVLTPSES